MSRLKQIKSTINKMKCAYIYTMLYRNGFLKSKPIKLATTNTDITNKLMHTIKSSINRRYKDNTNVIIKLNFSGSYLYVTLNSSFTYSAIKRGLITGYLNIAKEGLGQSVLDIVNITYNSEVVSLKFTMWGTDRYNMERDEKYEVLRPKLDSIVNALCAVPNVIDLLVKYIEDNVLTFDDRPKTLQDLYILWKIKSYDNVEFAYTDAFNITALAEIELPEQFTTPEYLNSISPAYYYYSTHNCTEDLKALLLEHGFITEGNITNEQD